MRLFDTLSRELRELSPVDGESFRFYCCGPTVYGPAHIGNFRTFVLQDVLRRVLEADGLKTTHVRNITDVDDKTIRDSVKAGKSLTEFTTQWRDLFHADCKALNCLEPHIEPSAVEHIPQQITMIEELVEKGHAYASEDGSVYFKISSFENYGKLSKLDTRELELGKTQEQRANSDEYEKGSAADFVLWKSRREEDGDNFWQSPWGEGRPGWHLECSAMIREYFGETFDLHSGGVDLVFPHHENEIAQSQCSCGGEFARHWFHTTHLLVDGGKMSKSLGNLYTLSDLEKEGWSASEVRYVLICAHYRKPLNFTFDSLHAAREALTKIAEARKVLETSSGSLRGSGWGGFEDAWKKITTDLNTPGALGAVFKRLKRAKGLTAGEAAQDLAGLDQMMKALGIVLPEIVEDVVEIPEDVTDLAERRWEAKLAKDWSASDALRDELTAKGWSIKDKADGYDIVPS